VDDLEPTLLIVPLLAVLAPLFARGLGRWVRVPIVVFELVLGILVGPSVLGWAEPNAFTDHLSEIGLALLFFVAGSEIEFAAMRGRLGRTAVGGWLISLVVGVGVGMLIAPGEPAVVIGVALCSTALGTILPILRDAGELRTPFGRAVAALGALGEFGPLVAITLFLGARSPGLSAIVLAAFVLVSGLAVLVALRAPHGRLHAAVNATLHTSGQFAIRVILLVLAALVFLSLVLDIDMLLGAFAAGVVWRLMMRDADEHDREIVESKVEALAFGFLVPVFFVYTGITFDLDALLSDPSTLVLLPLLLIALLLVRGVPSMLSAPVGSSGRERAAVALLGATGLPIIVAVTGIGVDEELITTATASALVGAGMLSVLIYPLVAMTLRGDSDATRGAPLEPNLAQDSRFPGGQSQVPAAAPPADLGG